MHSGISSGESDIERVILFRCVVALANENDLFFPTLKKQCFYMLEKIRYHASREMIQIKGL